MVRLIFPDYNKIKALPLFEDDEDGETWAKTYKFNLFDIYGDTYCRFVYNEDGNEKFLLDIMSGGYITDSETFECSVEGYKMMCCQADMLMSEVFENLTNSNPEYSEDWFRDY